MQRHWLTLALIGVPVMGGFATAMVQTFAAACYSSVGAAVFDMMYALYVHRKSDLLNHCTLMITRGVSLMSALLPVHYRRSPLRLHPSTHLKHRHCWELRSNQ